MDESSIAKNRRSSRSNVLLAATIEVGGIAVSVKLRNLSQEGALIEGERLPIEGSMTIFRRNELRIDSRIAWVQGRFAGVAFAIPLQPHEVLRNIPKPRPQAKLDFRRPGLACRELSADERRMVEGWMVASPLGSVGE